MKRAAILILLGSLFCGCATVESSRVGGHHMVSIKNTGWKFLNVVPIASGDTDHPNTCTTIPFGSSITLDNNIAMLDDIVKQSGARGFRHLSSSITEESIFFIVFDRRIYHTSAELVFDSDQAK